MFAHYFSKRLAEERSLWDNRVPNTVSISEYRVDFMDHKRPSTNHGEIFSFIFKRNVVDDIYLLAYSTDCIFRTVLGL